MLKLRARSRSFSSNGNANKEKEREHYPSGAKSKDDINLKPSGNNNNSIGEFPQELARSLQALALSLSTPSSAKVRVESGEAPSRPLPPIPLKPILRSSTSAVPTEDKGRIATGTTPGHRNNSSVSSTGSSKQISFILPENPTRSGSATAPEIRHAAASAVEGRQSRRSSASSRRASSSPSHSRVSSASTTAQIERAQLIQQKSVREFPVSLVLPPRANAKDEAEILHIKSRDTMQVNRAVQPKEGRRCSLGQSALPGSAHREKADVVLSPLNACLFTDT